MNDSLDNIVQAVARATAFILSNYDDERRKKERSQEKI